MNRSIIFFENHFIEFYQMQDQKVKDKIQYVFELIRQVDQVPEKFLKHLTGTNGLYEIRIDYQSNIFRILHATAGSLQCSFVQCSFVQCSIEISVLVMFLLE